MTHRPPPASASVAEQAEGADNGKLVAPSATRNAAALEALLRDYAPAEGRALELASGTGQHVVVFARAFDTLHWQPSDLDPARLRSIAAYIDENPAENLSPPLSLDATEPGWGQQHGGFQLAVLVNLLHLISEDEARCLIAETAQALSVGGMFVFYGPFKRDGALISEGDQQFDIKLRAHDPAIGYKDDRQIRRWLIEAGLTLIDTREMPANNLAFIARRA